MALNSSGPISLAGTTTGQSIELELGGTGFTMISLNDSSVRSLAGVPTGQIAMPTDFWGKPSDSYWIIQVTSGGAPLANLTSVDISSDNSLLGVATASGILVINLNTGVGVSGALRTTGIAIPTIKIRFASDGNLVGVSRPRVTTSPTKYNPQITVWNPSTGVSSFNANYTPTLFANQGSYAVVNGYITAAGDVYVIAAVIGPPSYIDYVAVAKWQKSTTSMVTSWQGTGSTSIYQTTFPSVTVYESNGDYYTNTSSSTSTSSVTYVTFMKRNSSNTLSWSKNVDTTFPSGSRCPSIDVDSSNTYVYAAVQVNDPSVPKALLFKLDAATGAVVKTISITIPNIAIASTAIDASNNLYVITSETTPNSYLGLYKFDSNLNLIWANKIVSSTGALLLNIGSKLSIKGNAIYITAVSTSPSASPIFKLPTDGSRLGTYTILAKTYTYSSHTATISNETYTVSNSSPYSSNSTNVYTPTVNTSYYVPDYTKINV
jgi:hypothetical protein